jgi:hypothetical protein
MQAPSKVKLQPDQTENLPYPVGCEVWYNIRTGGDGIAAKNEKTRQKSEGGGGMTKHGDLMMKKWGSLLGGNASDDVDAKNKVIAGQNSTCYSQLTFCVGVVSAVYLDLMASSIGYEVTPIKHNEKMPPGNSQFVRRMTTFCLKSCSDLCVFIDLNYRRQSFFRASIEIRTW